MAEQVVTEVTRRAMATEFGIVLPGEDRAAVETAIDTLEELERIEAELSVFRPSSAISRINALAGSEPVRVSADVIEVLQRAQALSRLSHGAFDVTAGPLVECWGFTRRRGRKPTAAEIEAARALVGSDLLTIDADARTVFLPRAGMSLNLGGIGKGFAIDRLASRLTAAGVSAFLIHGGRSSVLARGSDTPEPSAGWRVGVEHPLRPGLRLGELRLCDAALATSGSGKQFFHHQGVRHGHVLDPRLGRPAGDMLSLTVLATTATDADALATACFVDGLALTAQRLTRNCTAAAENIEPDWPLAALAVVPAERQGDVRLLPLGDCQRMRFAPAAVSEPPAA